MDISETGFKLVQLSKKKNNIFLNKFVSLKFDDDENNMDKVLTNIAKEKDFYGKQINLAMKSHEVFIRQFLLPEMSEKELSSAIPYEAENQHRIAMKDMVWDWFNIGKDTGVSGKVRVMFVCAKKEASAKYYKILENTGLYLNSLEVDVFSIFRVIKYNGLLLNNSNELIMTINMEHTNTTLLLTLGERYLFSRNIPIGEKHFTSVIIDIQGVSEKEARDLKNETDFSMHPTMSEIAAKLIKEIKDSIDFVCFQNINLKGKYKVIFAGEGWETKGILSFFQNELKMYLEALNPFEKLLAERPIEYKNISAGIATGLALRWWN